MPDDLPAEPWRSSGAGCPVLHGVTEATRAPCMHRSAGPDGGRSPNDMVRSAAECVPTPSSGCGVTALARRAVGDDATGGRRFCATWARTGDTVVDTVGGVGWLARPAEVPGGMTGTRPPAAGLAMNALSEHALRTAGRRRPRARHGWGWGSSGRCCKHVSNGTCSPALHPAPAPRQTRLQCVGIWRMSIMCTRLAAAALRSLTGGCQ